VEVDYPEGKTSYAAAEGTVAHSLAEEAYLLGVPADAFLGEVRKQEGHPIEIDREMVDSVQIFLDVIETLESPTLEGRILHPDIPDLGGTLDVLSKHESRVVDFKYGKGVKVEADHNPQLSCYALLYCRKHLGEIRDVTVTIVQPRIDHPLGPVRSWVATKEYLEDLEERIRKVVDGERAGELNAGDHCRWCPRAKDCPELFDLTLKLSERAFSEVDEGLTPEKAAEVIKMETAVGVYFRAVKDWTKQQLEDGNEVPGFKLVETFGNRRYAADEDVIVRKCRSRRFGKKAIYKTELLSPAQLEKVVGKQLVSTFTVRPSKGAAVVPESDKREAYRPTSVSETFKDYESE